MTPEHKPAECFSVGTFIQEEMEARGWTRSDLLDHMPGDRTQNDCWLDLEFASESFSDKTKKGLLPMSHDDAKVLAHAFGTSAEFWVNIDKAWCDYQKEKL